ncbi:MAG: TonB family protein [Pontiella sp.]
MNAFERNIALRVMGIHVAVILVLLMVSGLKGCFRPKPKPEIVTFIEFGSPAPAVDVQHVAKMSEPEPPAPAPKSEPAPVPEPVKKIIPPPTKKKAIAPPKKKEPPKVEPKPEPVKPKWTPTKASDINPNKSKRIVETPSKPTVSAADIRKELSNVQRSSKKSPGPVGSSTANSAYDSHIYTIFYNAWAQPGTSASRPTEVTISISSTGRIKSARISKSSGDAQFDATVQKAINTVKILPKKPPAGYPIDNIIVQFKIIE